MYSMHRMVSIDLNTPSPSLTTTFHGKNNFTKSISNSKQAGKFQLSPIGCKYFHTNIARNVSMIQLFLAVVVLICQLCTTGLLIGPSHPIPESSAISTSDRIGLGIWTSIVTTFAVGATFWAINKANFFRLHLSMILNLCSFLGYVTLEYLVLVSTIPRIQERIFTLQSSSDNEPNTTTLDARRQLLVVVNGDSRENLLLRKMKEQAQVQAELHRLYAALVLSIVMALIGIFELLLHLFMTVKTGRAICLGKTHFEGRLFQMQTIGRCWKSKSFGRNSKNNGIVELPKLERSDALPPPPYESGYFHPSLTV